MTAALMDREDIKTEWAKPQENPLEGMTQEDINKLLQHRSELLMDISEHYIALTKAIYKLPIHVVFRQQAFLFLDTAELWYKKGIDNVWDLPKESVSLPEADDAA